MSEFSDGATTPNEPAETPEVQTENYLEQFVGEGKQYATIEEAATGLAKKAVHADKHVETLLSEKQALEAQVQKARSIDDILEAISQQAPEPAPVTPETPVVTETPVDVDSIIGEIEKRNANAAAAAKRQEAVQAAWDKLVDPAVFGSMEAAKQAVQQYIGGNESRKALVDTMAVADPDNLIKILKPNRVDTTFTENHESASFEGVPQGALTWEYCKHIRKEKPELYNSKAFQQRMHNEL